MVPKRFPGADIEIEWLTGAVFACAEFPAWRNRSTERIPRNPPKILIFRRIASKPNKIFINLLFAWFELATLRRILNFNEVFVVHPLVNVLYADRLVDREIGAGVELRQ
jgi:hypothetical protein